MGSMKAVLHIGTEKTGTSSIQDFLLKNSDALVERNVCYLHMDGRNEYRDFSAYCMQKSRVDGYFRRNRITSEKAREDFDSRFLSSFRQNFESVPGHVHTVVMSSEHFSSRLTSVDEVYRAKEVLDQYFSSVQIVCYLRDQSKKICSGYSTFIKAGGRERFNDYFSRNVEGQKRPRSDYDHKIGLWEKVFGLESIKVRVFDRAEFPEGSLLNDFCNILDESLFDFLSAPIQHKNEALSKRGCELLRRINYLFPESIRGTSSVERARNYLIDRISQHTRGEPVSLTSDQLRLIKQRYGPSNERAREKYFPDLPYLFWSQV